MLLQMGRVPVSARALREGACEEAVCAAGDVVPADDGRGLVHLAIMHLLGLYRHLAL